MNAWLVLRSLVIFPLLIGASRADVWLTTAGDRFEGSLSGVYGPLVVIGEKNGSRQIALEALDDASLGRVADYLASGGATVEWAKSTSTMAKTLRGRMQVLRDNKLVPYAIAARPEPEIYLAYFGAHWCGPCRRFSPDLVRAYHALKVEMGDAFELVFMSSDHDGQEQLRYVREVAMPWPVLKFSAVGGAPLIERWRGTGIPNLVALTRDGEVILQSYHNGEYLGPQHVLNAFGGLAKSMKSDTISFKRPRHRLAVLQHIRAAAGTAAAVRPYVIDLDFTRYRTLEVKQLLATLEIDERGRVADASFEPMQEVVINDQLVRDASSWLFLPRIVEGRAQRTTVKLPLKL